MLWANCNMTKLRHYDDSAGARFVTFNCFRDGEYLSSREAKLLLIKHILEAREKHGFKLMGYVIMPDHVHLVLLPSDGMKLGLVIREIKSKMAREYFAAYGVPAGTHVFWQKRCHDRNCRSADEAKEKINYCHGNPVKAGLVLESGDYEWSSYNWYEGRQDVPLAMDDVEF
jgi:putative transposase